VILYHHVLSSASAKKQFFGKLHKKTT